MLTKDKILGCYWALALGDALGMPVEFSSIENIHENIISMLIGQIIAKFFQSV